jgi:hypothetical protein
MLTPSLLFPIAIRLIRLDRGSIVLEAHGMIHRGRCPACGVTSARVHDRYHRHPIDLPWRACPVQFALTVRRFCCDNRDHRMVQWSRGGACAPGETPQAPGLWAGELRPAPPSSRGCIVPAIGRRTITGTLRRADNRAGRCRLCSPSEPGRGFLSRVPTTCGRATFTCRNTCTRPSSLDEFCPTLNYCPIGKRRAATPLRTTWMSGVLACW